MGEPLKFIIYFNYEQNPFNIFKSFIDSELFDYRLFKNSRDSQELVNIKFNFKIFIIP